MFTKCRGCKTFLGLVLIVLGIVMIMIGIILYMKDTPQTETVEDNSELISQDNPDVTTTDDLEVTTEETVETPTEVSETENNVEDETTNVEMPETVLSFDENTSYSAHSFLKMDGKAALSEELPAFHQNLEITSYTGTNPKTELPSHNLKVVLSAIPDRIFSVSVLIKTDSTSFEGYQSEEIPGVHLTLSYEEGGFMKTLYEVNEHYEVNNLDPEAYNIRYEGLETIATIEFFSPLETVYYLVMIEDETFFTRVEPIN